MWPGAAKAKAGGGMRRPCSRPAHRHRHPSLSSPLLQFGPGPAPVLDGVPGGCRRLALCRGCGRASHLCRRHPAASRQGERGGGGGGEGRSHPRGGGEETWVGARGAPRVARPPARPARPPAQPGLPPSATFHTAPHPPPSDLNPCPALARRAAFARVGRVAAALCLLRRRAIRPILCSRQAVCLCPLSACRLPHGVVHVVPAVW